MDQAVSPKVSEGLRAMGEDAVHVLDYKMEEATDREIMLRAKAEGRIVVTCDTDYTKLLARHRDSKPSVILFRREVIHRPRFQLALLAANLPSLAESLEKGAVVVIDERRVRVRQLPIGGAES